MSGGHVKLESLTKRFDDVTAVDDISVEIQRGEFFSLLGPSGCGKTTTLRMIAGFEPPTSGQDPARRRERREPGRPTAATSTPCSRATRCSLS